MLKNFPTGAISPITQHTPGKEILFIETGDYLFMLHLIKIVVKKFNLRFLSCFFPWIRSLKVFEAFFFSIFRGYSLYFNYYEFQRRPNVFGMGINLHLPFLPQLFCDFRTFVVSCSTEDCMCNIKWAKKTGIIWYKIRYCTN